MANYESGSPAFPTTQWSLVDQLQQGNEDTACKALERLLAIYYQPLRLFLSRHFSATEDQSADWLQSFVWKKLVVRQLLTKADRSKGKLRTFLATALQNFVIEEIRRQRCRFRTPEADAIPAHEALDVPEGTIPVQFSHFNISWGQGILSETCRRMKQECQRKHQSRIWAVFEMRLLEPILHGVKPLPYDELCVKLGFKNDVDAGNALITAKRMFARIVRSVIREYTRDEAEVEAEIRELMQAFHQG